MAAKWHLNEPRILIRPGTGCGHILREHDEQSPTGIPYDSVGLCVWLARVMPVAKRVDSGSPFASLVQFGSEVLCFSQSCLDDRQDLAGGMAGGGELVKK